MDKVCLRQCFKERKSLIVRKEEVDAIRRIINSSFVYYFTGEKIFSFMRQAGHNLKEYSVWLDFAYVEFGLVWNIC